MIKPGTLRRASWAPEQKNDGSGGGKEKQIAGARLPTNEYPRGQCTWFVALLRPDLPHFPGESGNAENWIRSAHARGLLTGAVPRPGAVVVLPRGRDGAGYYGHVAVVVRVRDDLVDVVEANAKGDGKIGGRSIRWLGLQFIYRPGPGNGAQTPEPPPATPLTRRVTIDNRVTNGATAMREDVPAYLSTVTRNYCRRDGCVVAGTEVASGATVTATCQITGERTTNGQDGNAIDDRNPGLVESNRWYRIMWSDRVVGYLSEVWVASAFRGGLGLPTC